MEDGRPPTQEGTLMVMVLNFVVESSSGICFLFSDAGSIFSFTLIDTNHAVGIVDVGSFTTSPGRLRTSLWLANGCLQMLREIAGARIHVFSETRGEGLLNVRGVYANMSGTSTYHFDRAYSVKLD